MKRKLISLLAVLLLLICSLCGTAFADGVLLPVINSVSGDVYVDDGSVPVLKVNASSLDGGTLDYVWYSASQPDLQYIIAESTGTNSPEFVPVQTSGTRYYCVGISNVLNGEQSDWVYSDFIEVSFAQEEEEYTKSLEIVQTPQKWEYIEGERIDLTGLVVRVYTNKGYWDSYDGAGLDYSGEPLSTIGDLGFEIGCEDAKEVIWISVTPLHTSHSYGEWEVAKEATCTEQGLEKRECECGLSEERVLKKLEHDWNEGTVKVEATATKPGTRVFTCKLCNTTKTETIMPTGKDNKPKPTPVPTPGTPETPKPTDTPVVQRPVEDRPEPNDNGGAHLWMLLVIMTGALALVVGVAYVIIKRREMY